MRENGRSERLKSGADVQPCLSDVYKNGTRAKRRQADAPLCGRSMVEMLGVLAIIGVLSVGAMSGYAKAMFKYKLNRQTEQIGSILDYATIHYEALDRLNLGEANLSSLFQQLDAIPPEMIKDKYSTYLYDVFNNKVRIYHNKEDDGDQYFGLQIYIDKSTEDICLNLYQMAKLRSGFLWHTVFSKTISDNPEEQFANRIYGDAYCPGNIHCLKNLTISDMQNFCSTCKDESETCSFVFLWNFKHG